MQKPLVYTTLLLAFLSPVLLAAQKPVDCTNHSDAEAVKLAIQEVCGNDFNCIKAQTALLLNSDQCFCEQIGKTLDIYFSFHLTEHDHALNSDCLTPYFLYPFTLASKAFEKLEFQKAIDWYWDAEAQGAPASSCISNIGAAYFQLGQYGFARHCFEHAYENTELNNAEAYMVLNNLTAIQMQAHNWDDALKWLLLAKSNMAQLIDGYDEKNLTLSNKQSAVVEANEWLIRIELKDDAFIRDRWKAIQWGNAQLPAEQWLKLVLKTGTLINDDSFYQAHVRLVKQLYSEYLLQPERTVTFGAYTSFLDRLSAASSRDFDAAIEEWKWIESLIKEPMSTEPTNPEGSHFSQDLAFHAKATSGAWVLALVLTALAVAAQLRHNKTSAARKSNASNALETLKDWHLGKVVDFDRVQSSLESLESSARMNLSGWLIANGIELNEAEHTILRHAIANVSPKETATKHNWSPNYVYKIRSQLRVKIGAPADADLNNWVHSQFQNQ